MWEAKVHFVDEALSDVIKPGKPDEEARGVFFEAITQIAHRNGDTLALPSRSYDREIRDTPFYKFAAGARDLVVAYGNAILDRRQLPRGRFDGLKLSTMRSSADWSMPARRFCERLQTRTLNSTICAN